MKNKEKIIEENILEAIKQKEASDKRLSFIQGAKPESCVMAYTYNTLFIINPFRVYIADKYF